MAGAQCQQCGCRAGVGRREEEPPAPLQAGRREWWRAQQAVDQLQLLGAPPTGTREASAAQEAEKKTSKAKAWRVWGAGEAEMEEAVGLEASCGIRH